MASPSRTCTTAFFQARVRPAVTPRRLGLEGTFDVRVVEVRTASVKSKPKRRGLTAGRTRSWKKAIVQVRPGQSIPIFQGLEADL